MSEVDEKFYNRADEHINLSNDQLSSANRGQVSASMMFSLARFNAWVSACEVESSKEMQESKAEAIKYFVTEFEKMLTENMDDYIENFDTHMKQP